ncbi:MAG: NHLP family bacteriocin export ABC transporter peptidase/permease/ATPase subunit [Lachnospiraceae bacterium]|nr:NHLP family bacteriocin export ABC transporter peptidase/permease/ATPase subunit [Lachnospiraceae bacterium]
MKEENKKIKQPVNGGVAKVPVIMQMEALECGAACLTMILSYYEKWIPLEQVRKDCGVSRDGSNAKNILKAAGNYHMESSGYRYEPDALKKSGGFPCIIHWGFNHFVVLKGFKGDKVYLNDPAKGSCIISMEEFDKEFTGICLMMSPGEGFEPSGKKKSILEFAKKRMTGTGSAVAFVALTTMIISFAGIIRSGFSRVFLDQLLTGDNPDWLVPFMLGMVLLAVVQITVTWINAVYALRINGKMTVIGETTYMWKVMQLPMEFFSQRMAGDIQQRKSTNARIAGNLVNTMAPLFLNTFMMIFYLIVMFRYSIMLTIVGISAVLINLALSRYISDKRVNISRILNRDSGKLASATVSGIEMIETIKSSGAENGYFEKWAGYQASVNTQNIRFAKMNQYLGLIPGLVQQLANISILLLGIYLVMQGAFTVGMVMAFQGFLSAFTAPAEALIGAGQVIQEMRTDMERIEDVMEYPMPETAKEEADDTKEYDKLSGLVELKHITFGYSPLKDPLIKDFNMTLKQGSRVAFVGSSGCGKSTLAKLISGLYESWEGEILFDGKSIKEIDRSIFTGSVAVVDQDIILFDDTIASNIRMWDKSIEDYEIILAARDARIHDDIMLREGGYQYKLNEGGTDLSGGQRQRLEIARVLAQDPTIIVMDEATSALDAKTEFDVVNAIKDRGITCIVIAHRLSTIRDCDEIIVLERGNVMERGTHDELMAKNGAYAQLVVSE